MLDHIVFAGPDLAAAVGLFRELTGVEPAPGGSHVGLGTANFLVDVGAGAYLEIIGPDPEQPAPDQPRPFGIDALTEPRIVTWAARSGDLAERIVSSRAAGYDPGPAVPMSRATPDGGLLEWRLTPPVTGGSGLVPFLIDWGTTQHPTERPLPGTPLVSWSATHPRADGIRSSLAALGVELSVTRGNRPALIAVVEGTAGPVVLT